MSTIFDFIEATIFTKNKELLQSSDDEKEFSPYMVNRWLSMYSPQMCNVVNETTNKYSVIFDNKKDLFDFYVSVLPSVSFKRVSYIKKSSKEDKEFKHIDLIANTRQTSQREVIECTRLVEFLTAPSNI